MFKSGFIMLIGTTNVGKSTLLNCLINKKISITSHKKHTTVFNILGILNNEKYQMIFVDTPGIYKEKKNNLSDRKRNSLIWKNINEIDICLFVVEKECGSEEKEILNNLIKFKKKVILVINKLDIKKNILIDKIILSYLNIFDFDYIIPISALKKKNIDILIKNIFSSLEEGPLYFPKEVLTDISKEKIITEFVREKILYFVHQEIPHICSVILEDIIYNKDSSLEISVLIYVSKTSHKKILIGKDGYKLKRIGIEARKDINRYLNNKIYLNLWVKVQKK
ncbi:GTPase Era [Texas Phoenix palm phytoplasma]|uniref:GTPase Era n=1 Tax=Texas Phoenix palm phytoplasma TaxID=176709 RepID=A0ABS5BHY5_9MOLU|nr:GTPase Era [Texas Phoenix palm phytoplasma]MBP3059190.1 GTPase Era [Texas Phoenix palm phytoplasma]